MTRVVAGEELSGVPLAAPVCTFMCLLKSTCISNGIRDDLAPRWSSFAKLVFTESVASFLQLRVGLSLFGTFLRVCPSVILVGLVSSAGTCLTTKMVNSMITCRTSITYRLCSLRRLRTELPKVQKLSHLVSPVQFVPCSRSPLVDEMWNNYRTISIFRLLVMPKSRRRARGRR